MIVHFPSLDTLRLALTSGAIPEAVRATATHFRIAEDQSLWMETAAELDRTTEKELRRLGVRFPPLSAIELSEQATDWLQMFPLTRDPHGVDIGDKTPILFEITKAGQLAALTTEILRLGNDRQSFRWLGDGAESKALLRVVGPPYYSLLRASDGDASDDAPIAYREVVPRVWIQIGFTYPLAEHLKPPVGQSLLIRRPQRWEYVPEAKLRDIYEVIDFQLPHNDCAWHDDELPGPIRVPVKLTRSGALDAAELWLIREAGIAQLEELVRSSDNDLLARLAFAVGTHDGQRIVVLRVRPSKNEPPVLVLDGIAFRSYLRIPNLFVPVGMTLYPPLRRGAVIKLLSEDTTRITWLVPHADHTFTPESLPDEAFRPLPEWVDYVLEHEHQAIERWIGASQFQFEGFICKDDQTRPPKPPKQPRKATPKESAGPEQQDLSLEPIEAKKPRPADLAVETELHVEPGDLANRLRQTEEAFAALTVPLDDPKRHTLWRELAQLNGALGHHGDAAICWSNALWEEPHVTADSVLQWLGQEAKQPIGPAQIGRMLSKDVASHANLRQLTAYLIWAAAAAAPVADLARIQRYLEKHESYLGVRMAWLAWHALHHLAGGDILTLARARDRLLERLFLHGLTPELDLPGFLRHTGRQASERFRLVRDQLMRLHKLVQDWAKTGTNPTPATHAYIDLIFAFGLARLGEASEARNLLGAAAHVLAHADEVHSWLFEAFEFRIQQTLDGKPGVERLPQALLQRLEAIERPAFLEHLVLPELDRVKQASRLQRLKIERLRTASRILEPLERLYAYRHWLRPSDDELKRELTALTDLHDRAELTQRLENLLTGKQKITRVSKTDPRILVAALELAPRLGQAFGEKVLDRIPEQLAKLKDLEKKAELLEKALFLAAHYDRKEDVQRFVTQLQELLRDSKALPYDKLIPLIAGSFRSLRKFGLRDAVHALMQQLGTMVDAAPNVPGGVQLGKRHCLLLELAAGWLFYGEEARARKILGDARAVLGRKELSSVQQTELACAYLTALGQAPMEFALARMMEFFRTIEGIYDNYTTVSHYSLTRLNVVEAMMLAVCSDDFTLDPEARRRLDEDEYLVRRRIHRDMRAAMGD